MEIKKMKVIIRSNFLASSHPLTWGKSLSSVLSSCTIPAEDSQGLCSPEPAGTAGFLPSWELECGGPGSTEGKISDSQGRIICGQCDLTSFPCVWTVTGERLLVLFPGGVRAWALGEVPCEGNTPVSCTLFPACSLISLPVAPPQNLIF